MKKTLEQLRREALDALGAGSVPASVLELRAAPGGEKLTQAAADELLAKAVARDRVSVVMSVLAYEQGRRDAKGVVLKNRKGVRVRNGAMQALGRSGKGTPFMRDHEQRNSLAKSGTVIESKTTQLTDDGHFQVLQEVELTEPTAVERALRGLVSAVSVGLEPLGPVTCTACKTEIFTSCFHWPFDVVKLKDGSEVEVEWEYSEAGLRETSEVPIGAVHHAAVQSVRAQLDAQLSGVGTPLGADHTPPKESSLMKMKLLALLGLAATASDDEVLAAVEAQQSANKADKAELAIKTSELSAFQKDIDALKADKAKRDEDAFILGALSTGRIGKGDEEQWRALFLADSKRAVELMAKREPNTATPVGAPRQSDQKPEPKIELSSEKPGFATPKGALAARANEAMERLRSDRGAALMAAKIFNFHIPGYRFTQAELSATAINNDAALAQARIAWNAIFLDQAPYMASPLLQLAYETNTTRESEMYRFLTGVPQMEEWKNDRIMSSLSALALSVENKPYQATMKLKNRDILNDVLGLIAPTVQDMVSDARNHPATLIAEFLKAGFTTNLAFDGDTFFATTHATGSNKVAAGFDATNFASAIALLRAQKRMDGVRYLDARPTHLYVGISNEAAAEKILKQDTLANGESNMNKGKCELVVVPELTTEWFVADQSRASRPVVLQHREPLTTSTIGGRSSDGAPAENFVGFVYDETWFGAQAAYGVGGWDFRRIVGGKA